MRSSSRPITKNTTTRRRPESIRSMSSWVTSSRAALVLALCALAAVSARPAAAKVFLSVDDALKVAFPGCQVERRTAYLTPAQVQKVKELSGCEVTSALVIYINAVRGGQPS